MMFVSVPSRIVVQFSSYGNKMSIEIIRLKGSFIIGDEVKLGANVVKICKRAFPLINDWEKLKFLRVVLYARHVDEVLQASFFSGPFSC